MIVLIDNYDSFTYNLVHLLGDIDVEVEVIRNDKISIEALEAKKPEAIILSPGPCDPDDAGICLDIVGQLGDKVPLFGVCLGHQTIAQSFGGTIIRAQQLCHGKTNDIYHYGHAMFADIPEKFTATRYHSLIAEQASLPDCFEVTAATKDGIIMAVAHKEYPIYGVQFHPESIASEYGMQMMRNFFKNAQITI